MALLLYSVALTRGIAMVGRDACRRPWHYSTVDEEVFGAKNPIKSRRALLDAYATYCDRAEVDLAHDAYSPRRAVLVSVLLRSGVFVRPLCRL